MWVDAYAPEHKRTSSPSHSNECDSQNESVGVTCSARKGGRGSFCVSFSSACEYEWRRGEITVIAAVAAQSLLIAFWTLTCFFFFSYRETKCSCTAWLTHCLIAQKPPPPPCAPHVFKSNSSSVLFSPSLPLPLTLHSDVLVYIALIGWFKKKIQHNFYSKKYHFTSGHFQLTQIWFFFF